METTDSDQQRGGGCRDGDGGEKRWWKWKESGSKSGKGWEERRRKRLEVNIDCGWMQFFFFSPSPHLPPVLLLLWATEQEALHHPDRQRKRREGERKRDCDGGIKGYPSLSVTSFIVPCSVLPAHPSSAVTCTHTKNRHTLSTHFHTLDNYNKCAEASKTHKLPTASQARWCTNTKLFEPTHTEKLSNTQTEKL